MSEEEKREELNQEEREEEEQNQEIDEEEEENEEEEELKDEDIKELAKNATEKEAKYILQLSEWNRPGDSFTDWGKIRILEGRIQKVQIDHVYNYPTTNQWDYLIIPLTKVVVLLHESFNDYNGDEDERRTVYVFSSDGGWKSLRL